MLTLQVFFLDHNTKTTTFIDPRLPTVQPALNPGHQMPLPRNKYRVTDNNADSSDVSNLPTGSYSTIRTSVPSHVSLIRFCVCNEACL